VFNFPDYKRDARKQHLDFISPQLEWPQSRVTTTTNVGKAVAKQEPLYTADGKKN
jgi:hypothetical protein